VIDMMEHLESTNNDRTALCIVDTEGNAGKTALCRYIMSTYEALYIVGGKHSDIMHMVTKRVLGEDAVMPTQAGSKRKEMEIKDLQFVCVDITRQDALRNQLPWNAVEQILNGMGNTGKYNSSGFVLKYRVQVVVFTNVEPDYTQLSADRWFVINLKASGPARTIKMERIDVKRKIGQIFRAVTMAEGDGVLLLGGGRPADYHEGGGGGGGGGGAAEDTELEECE